DVRALVVTAVAAERDAVLRAFGSTPQRIEPYDVACFVSPAADVLVLAAGAIGPAAAAAATATVLAKRTPCDLVVSAGVAGAFRGSGAQPADVVVATEIVPADVGVQNSDG